MIPGARLAVDFFMMRSIPPSVWIPLSEISTSADLASPTRDRVFFRSASTRSTAFPTTKPRLIETSRRPTVYLLPAGVSAFPLLGGPVRSS